MWCEALSSGEAFSEIRGAKSKICAGPSLSRFWFWKSDRTDVGGPEKFMILNKESGGICKIFSEHRFHDPPTCDLSNFRQHFFFDNFRFFDFSMLYRDFGFQVHSNPNSALTIMQIHYTKSQFHRFFLRNTVSDFGECFAPLPLYAEGAPRRFWWYHRFQAISIAHTG